ncbi:MAG TPA: TetR/AcrR family transcriptional regulator [Chloroflexia bacterium]|nr:TetR/AcrR family transcriptional regulator [Chloroflexia bacterium]
MATYSVFAKQGFAETSLADIAAAADFSKAMVIYYFKSKENLLVAAFEWITSGILERLEACCLGLDSAEPMLRAQLEQLFISTRRNRRFYHVYLDFLAQSVHNARLGSVTGRFYIGCINALARTITIGVEQGVFYPCVDPREASSVCGAMMDGLQMQWLFDDEEKFEEYRERCWRGWLALLRAHD